MKQRVTTYAMGGYDPGQPNNNVVSDVTLDVPGLGVDRPQIAADGVDVATFDYFTDDPSVTTATWTVNGVDQPAVALTGGAATLQVTTTTAGKVEVSCNGEPSITIEAT